MLEDFDMPNTPSPSSGGGGSGGGGRDSSGILRTKIQLGRKPSVIMPFYLMKPDLPPAAPIAGSMNLLSYYCLDHTLSKFCGTKKLKEELSAFLPHLPGNIDLSGNVDNSCLKTLVEKPPIVGKEIHPLTSAALAGFRLQPGSIPDHLKPFGCATLGEKKRHKRKHEKTIEEEKDGDESSAAGGGGGLGTSSSAAYLSESERKAKRMRKEEEREKKKKKKKDKKKKKLGTAAAAVAAAAAAVDENPNSSANSATSAAAAAVATPNQPTTTAAAGSAVLNLSSVTDFKIF